MEEPQTIVGEESKQIVEPLETGRDFRDMYRKMRALKGQNRRGLAVSITETAKGCQGEVTFSPVSRKICNA